MYSTREDEKAEIFNFIEMRYNPKSAIHTQAVLHLLSLRKRTILSCKLPSESWEVQMYLCFNTVT
ncbi:hypothetical protein [Pseudoalteromonas mariniglutinosa]|uniref:hypothetical protein n=1 Tax=Pseudoalteromonas mariniglutinosa TaxID=206042 RepID=UPI0034DB1697